MKNLVLLHGALGDEVDLLELKAKLKGQFNCFTYTFYGHGRFSKDSKPFDIAIFAKELKSFILENRISDCSIFGYSMGGFVATYFAYKNPALVSQITTYGTQFNWTPEIAHKEVKLVNPETIALKIPAFARALEKKHGQYWKTVLNKTAHLMNELGKNNPLDFDSLQSIQTKVTILRGSEDKMIDSEFSRKVSLLLPNSSFHEISEMPHPLQHVDLEKLVHFIALG